MKRALSITTLFVVLLLAVACGGGEEETEAPTSAPAPTEAAAVRESPVANPVEAKPTDTPKPSEPTAVVEPATVEPEPTLTEEQLQAFEKLDSYRAAMTWTSQGTDADGNAIDDTAEILIEYVKDPLARRMTMSIDTSDAVTESLQTFEMYQIGPDLYMNSGEDVGWLRIQQGESPLDDPSIALLTGGEMFSNLEDLERVRPDERINGIDSRHYKYDEKVLGKLIGDATGEVDAEGDVWIAKDGGYVTKYTLTIDVKDGSAGSLDPSMAEGTFNMTWELRDVNSRDISIELPAEAAAGTFLAGFEEGFPTPEGANVTASSNAFLIAETDLAVADVTKFYEEELAKLGWTKDEASSGSFGDMSSLSFTNEDGIQLSVMVTVDSTTGKTQIMANSQTPES